MVKKVFNFISREVGGLHEAAYLLGFFALLSQILALFRDRLLAYTFGASQALDIYYTAFRIPDFMFVSVASLVSMSVLIPFLMERIDKGHKEVKVFIDAVFSFFFFTIAAISILAFIFTPFLLKIFFPVEEQDYATLIHMTRIMLLSPIFLGFSNFLASVTQIYKRFFIYALSPIFYNLGIIIGIVFFHRLWGMEGLAWGVALGAFLHFFIQVPFVLKKGLFPRLRFNAHFREIRSVILTSLPRTLTLSSNEIAKFFLISFAATMAGGAISIFNFSWNLQSVPLTIVGVSYSLAAFQVLTRLYTQGDKKKFVEQMITSSKHIIFWSIPIMVMFIVLRAQIVRVILGSGNFSWSDTRLTAAALALFTVSLIPQGLTLLFVRAYYSRGDTKKPLLMNVVSAGLIIVFSYTLIYLFTTIPFFRYFIQSLLRVDDLPGSLVLMLPLGFSLGTTINMIMHWIAYEKDFKGYTSAIMRSLFQTLGASIIMGYVTYLLLNLFDRIFDLNTFYGIFMQGFLSGILGIIVGVILLKVLKNKELEVIVSNMKSKIWKTKVIPPDVAV
ncbi:MAG: murein biosynthesis integral membrane protein MurJ [bacterium]|nr:murein biosynthesis integral membrane protein MurJ [bacterium]